MTSVDELERLSALIDLVYRGAGEPGLWPDIMTEASRWIGAPKGMLYTPLHGPEQGGFYFQHGLTDHFLEAYKSRYQAADLWTQAVVRGNHFVEGNVFIGTDLVPHETLVRSSWYRDCLELGDISRLLTSAVFGLRPEASDPRIADMPTACSFYRPRTEENFTDDERRKLKLLVPHFSRALGVMTRLRLSDLKVASSLSALDRLSAAVLLMSHGGDVLFANRSAKAMLASTDVVALERSGTARGLGRLVAKAPRVNADITRALGSARRIDDVQHFSSVIRVPVRGGGQEWLLQLSRAGLGSGFSTEGELPEVIAFMTDPRRPLDLSTDVLARVYGLTFAEARVAVAATGGGSLEDIAGSLSVSVNTVKSQLRQVYAKTGAAGRAELVRLVLGLASGD